MAVLLVHGLWGFAQRLAPLKAGLEARGIDNVHALDLVPNDGRAPIAELGAIVGRAASKLGEKVDIVGFSMDALVSRWYVQRGGGKERVRRFVSISGPHHGTKVAVAAPSLAGARDMRPESDLLLDLGSDTDPFGPVAPADDLRLRLGDLVLLERRLHAPSSSDVRGRAAH